ncbi:hypothetical protein EYR40_002260 [Pleurotus pulmonarius]|nr:hypothetical protein EYR36_002248 [Pleurotus pulmonarius]KAF4583769.1 hypothetical protein EYR40_002260 [Pleurotus pulmonarius]
MSASNPTDGAPPLSPGQQALEKVTRGLQAQRDLASGSRKRGRDQSQITVDRDAAATAKRYLEQLGKGLARLIDPFRSLAVIITTGSITIESMEPAGAQMLSNVAKLEHQHHIDAYNMILSRLPKFQVIIDGSLTCDYGTQWEDLLSVLTAMSETCRSNDTSSLKRSPCLFLSETDPTPPELQRADKSERCFNNNICAKLLCPIKYKDQPDAIQQIKDGTIRVHAGIWPTFVYEEGLYDADDIEKGLLRRWLLVRVMRHIFTGPATAMKPSQKLNRGCNTDIMKLTCVTPNMIAYVAVQTCIMLSTVSSWSKEDGDFTMSTFFDRILNMFCDDNDGEWSLELLNWWNIQVFPGILAVSEPCHDEDEEDEDQCMKRQRLERRNCQPAPAQPFE